MKTIYAKNPSDLGQAIKKAQLHRLKLAVQVIESEQYLQTPKNKIIAKLKRKKFTDKEINNAFEIADVGIEFL